MRHSYNILLLTKITKELFTNIFLACQSPNKECQCSVQGPSACKDVSLSFCNRDTDRCDCFPYTTPAETGCISTCPPLLISDGSTIYPYISDESQLAEFDVCHGEEPHSSNSFGVMSNGFRLKASGKVR